MHKILLFFALFLLASLAQESESEERPIDFVVIGSGISGMAAASTLAQHNKKVVVLEQHRRAGGCTHTYGRNVAMPNSDTYRAIFDSGFHALTDGLNKGLLELLYGEDVHFGWPAGYPRDVVFVGQNRYEVPNGGNASFVDWMMQTFPEDEAGIRTLVRQMKPLRGSTRRGLAHAVWDLLPQVTKASILQQEASMFEVSTELAQHASFEAYLHSTFTNADLRMILASTVSECSALPPMFMPAQAGVDTIAMFAEGFSFPIEGPQALIDVMEQRLAARGGEIRTNADVVEVLLDPETQHVRGVKLSTGEEIEAKNVISSIGLDQTRALMPTTEIPSMPTPPDPMLHSMSAFVTNVVLDQSARQLGLAPYFIGMPMNIMPWVLDDMSGAAIMDMRAPVLGFEKTLRTTAFEPSENDPPAVVELFAATFWWEWAMFGGTPGHRDAMYNATKELLQDRQLEAFYMYYPQARGHVVFKESGTPKTIEFYVRKTHGTALGYIGIPLELKPHLETGITGLTFCGCDVMSSVSYALASGTEAAAVAMKNTNLIKQLAGLIWPDMP